jgi:hypothetical protein
MNTYLRFIVTSFFLYLSTQLTSGENFSDLSQINQSDHRIAYRIDANKYDFNPCEPIIPRLSFANISDATISTNIPYRNFFRNIKFTVFNEIDNATSFYTMYGKNIYKDLETYTDKGSKVKLNSSSGPMIEIPPQENYCTYIVINRIFDMTLSGNYCITSSFSTFEWRSSSIIASESNLIHITIQENESITKSEENIINKSINNTTPESQFAPDE